MAACRRRHHACQHSDRVRQLTPCGGPRTRQRQERSAGRWPALAGLGSRGAHHPLASHPCELAGENNAQAAKAAARPAATLSPVSLMLFWICASMRSFPWIAEDTK